MGAGCHLPYFVIDTNTNLIEERNRRLTRTGLERFKNVKKNIKFKMWIITKVINKAEAKNTQTRGENTVIQHL